MPAESAIVGGAKKGNRMNRIWTNSRGNMFQSGIGGTYPVNNGDPQCDVDLEEEEDAPADEEESQATDA
jgi:hypothetical protein